MPELRLATAATTDLEVFTNPYDLLRDVHKFVQYVAEHTVKRSHRENTLGKPDAKRIAKILSAPDALAQVEMEGYSTWLDYVDGVALELDLVRYDTRGTYAGYTSHQASFPNNFIHVQAENYQQFLRLDPLQQARQLHEKLVAHYTTSDNELFRIGVLGCLGSFTSYGCATGVVPQIAFDAGRRFLLDQLLEHGTEGVWHATADLVAYLKHAHPYFLIPKHPKAAAQGKGKLSRYGNFREGTQNWSGGTVVPDDAPDGFERVEGRFVERFLEGLPLTLGYVDVAYGRGDPAGSFPQRNWLQAFRLRRRLRSVLREETTPARVTVQPNFEIHVEGEFYPAGALAELSPFTRLVSEDRVTVLKLDKQTVAAALVKNDSLEVGAVLQRLSGRALPPNVALELAEWAGHAEQFTLYSGFALLEGNPAPALVDPFTVEVLAPNLRLVRTPQRLYQQLEQAEWVPLRVTHPAAELCPLPRGATTVFPRQGKQVPAAKPKPERVVVRRETSITLHLPHDAVFQRLQAELAQRRCAVVANPSRRTLTFPPAQQKVVAEAMKALRPVFDVRTEDLEAP